MIKVMIVDDSPVARELLREILGSDPEIEIVCMVGDGHEAVAAAERCSPDVVTMDIHMPNMNGLEATRTIMEVSPRPIVIVSGSCEQSEVEMSFKVMEAGAVAVVRRPAGPGDPNHEREARQLLKTVKLMSEVRVIRRWPRSRAKAPSPAVAAKPVKLAGKQVNVVAIGASTGGPVVLQTILSKLPGQFPAPIVVVQHMASGFLEGFVHWLESTCKRPVQLARQGQWLSPGHVYIAPDNYQCGLSRRCSIELKPCAPKNGLCPSVAHLFQSVAEHCSDKAVGVLLTGMGKDGAAELGLMKERGAVTFAQDSESSVIHGMPGEAIRLGAASFIMPPERIAEALGSLAEIDERVSR